MRQSRALQIEARSSDLRSAFHDLPLALGSYAHVYDFFAKMKEGKTLFYWWEPENYRFLGLRFSFKYQLLLDTKAAQVRRGEGASAVTYV